MLTATSDLHQSHWFRCLQPLLGRHVSLQTLSDADHLSVAEIYVYVLNDGKRVITSALWAGYYSLVHRSPITLLTFDS